MQHKRLTKADLPGLIDFRGATQDQDAAAALFDLDDARAHVT